MRREAEPRQSRLSHRQIGQRRLPCAGVVRARVLASASSKLPTTAERR
jgi:hypothetical protein